MSEVRRKFLQKLESGSPPVAPGAADTPNEMLAYLRSIDGQLTRLRTQTLSFWRVTFAVAVGIMLSAVLSLVIVNILILAGIGLAGIRAAAAGR